MSGRKRKRGEQGRGKTKGTQRPAGHRGVVVVVKRDDVQVAQPTPLKGAHARRELALPIASGGLDRCLFSHTSALW